ncbi:uncharacterized protein PV06_06300 [Exophiala oligosperma]|uniref:Methyltransferase domain-containing protein n=1 Tax=Exophiala oligosperma TaxID=215243 RepID=A0A0D2BZ92_9EURO|nr:uncharacterized protein PV06_06300 [Exophiala oligosperma]KIW42787.1 hypothetical protein PV06_06300 [Exophiala oligosperma]
MSSPQDRDVPMEDQGQGQGQGQGQDPHQLFLDADHDSAIGEEERDILSTSSLRSSVYQFRRENGRTYNRYGDRGKSPWDLDHAGADHAADYVLPNDAHCLLMETFGPGLTACGVENNRDVQRVLDVGTGTGCWALEFADNHPEATVTGVDISLVQPTSNPPNLSFELWDVEKQWEYDYKFDLIFSRMMTGAISQWRKFVRQSFDNLNPGGYLEVQDISFHLRSLGGNLPEDSALAQWTRYMLEASIRLGAPLDSIDCVRDIMIDTGFEDVQQKSYVWPMNPWSRIPHYERLGSWIVQDFTTSLTGISVALFTRGLGWTPTELEVFLVGVREDMHDESTRAWWPLYVPCISFDY